MSKPGGDETSEALLQGLDMCLSYGLRPILDRVTLSVANGSVLGVVGPSGVGKTSLAKVLCGLQALDSGSVLVDGRSLGTRTSSPPIMVWQEVTIFDHLNVRQNVELGARLRGAHAISPQRTMDLLDGLGLAGQLNRPVRTLSGGERARIGFARALLVQPQVLVLDEPFASLDIATRARAADLLKRYATGPKRAAILISHAREDIFQLCDEVLILESPATLPQQPLKALVAEPRTGFEAGFGGFWTVVSATQGQPDTSPRRCRTRWGDFAADWAAWVSHAGLEGGAAAMIFRQAELAHSRSADAIPAEVIDCQREGDGYVVTVTVQGNPPLRVVTGKAVDQGDEVRIVPVDARLVPARTA